MTGPRITKRHPFLICPQGEARLTRWDANGRQVSVEFLQIVPVVLLPGPVDDPILRKFSSRRPAARP